MDSNALSHRQHLHRLVTAIAGCLLFCRVPPQAAASIGQAPSQQLCFGCSLSQALVQPNPTPMTQPATRRNCASLGECSHILLAEVGEREVDEEHNRADAGTEGRRHLRSNTPPIEHDHPSTMFADALVRRCQWSIYQVSSCLLRSLRPPDRCLYRAAECLPPYYV